MIDQETWIFYNKQKKQSPFGEHRRVIYTKLSREIKATDFSALLDYRDFHDRQQSPLFLLADEAVTS